MDKLAVFNDALRLCGERKLANLTENREPRRLLDDAWSENYPDTWLEEADWNFAMTFVKMQPDPSIDLTFGYANAFKKPTDFVRVAGVWQDEYQQVPLRGYNDEANIFYSDFDELYVAYISNSNTLGSDLGTWPRSFGRWVSAFLAHEISPRIKNDSATENIGKKMKMRLLEAKNNDAMKNPSKQLPQGAWAGSRKSRRTYRHGYPS